MLIMSSRLLTGINLIVVSALALSMLATGALYLQGSPEIRVWDGAPQPKPLPQSAFKHSKNAYDAIGSELFTLRFTPPKMQLPDLSKVLTYLGPNGRPDVARESGSIYFALSGNKDQAAAEPGEKLYLLYDRQQKPPRYVFSPDNRPTSLWIEAEPQDKATRVTVSMLNEEGEVIQEPRVRADFTLPQKEFVRFARGDNWQLGEWRVDGTLLARQKAKWFGDDKFFERHGGEEFEAVKGKQRIDFGEEEGGYSVFLGENEILVWDGKQWKEASPGPDTLGKPILVMRKGSERLLTFDLWNPEGSSKLTLNLLKAQERWIPEQLQSEFKFIAAKTRSQYIFEVGGKKMTLTPQDWLVKTENGWEKLDTIEEIDGYIDRKIVGPMFVFDGVERLDDRQVLTGTLFSKSRSEMETVELDVPQSSVTVIKIPKSARPLMGNRTILEKSKTP
ncbi:MAG: hypothetical protein KDK48_02490 [Chlamydiia bacterium]|nr:hypothetical protein [Chlamydiia bacterium]